MDAQLFSQLVISTDPLRTVFDDLTGAIWTRESFEAAHDLERQYLEAKEVLTSNLEHDLYEAYFELYSQLEGPNPLKKRALDLLKQPSFTLLIFDALSLREMPALLHVIDEGRLSATVSFALAGVPSSTEAYCRTIFGVNNPKSLQSKGTKLPFTFHFLQKPEDTDQLHHWRGDRHVIWARIPDSVFDFKDHDAVRYAEHIIKPVQSILGAVLTVGVPRPLVITSDHGYIWQGGDATWRITDDRERMLLADQFAHGRSTDKASSKLGEHTHHVWQSGSLAAARGRFGWGEHVRGATRRYKHEGVSLMECMTPWIVIEE